MIELLPVKDMIGQIESRVRGGVENLNNLEVLRTYTTAHMLLKNLQAETVVLQNAADCLTKAVGDRNLM